MFLVLDTENDVIVIEKIYNKYSKFMYRVTFDILKNKFDAEDAVQQAFIKLALYVNKIGDIESKKTRNFIGIICRNEAIDIYNKRKNNVDIDEYEDITDNSFDLGLIVISKESLVKIEDFIYTLDKKYQDVLILKGQYEYSISEIAEILNISTKLAQKRLERGRKKVSEFLKREGEKE